MELVIADPELATAIDRVNHIEWGVPLDVPGHMEREARLRRGLWPTQSHRWFVLREGGASLASCEVYRMPSSHGMAYGIASVFVEPHLRGRGYSTALLDRVEAQLATEPDAAACVLFSDIGPELYARRGYAARPAFDWIVSAALCSPAADLAAVETFSETALAGLTLRPPVGPFAIVPIVAQLDWHLDRARLVAEIAGRTRGARCGARVGEESVIIYTDAEDELLVLLAYADGPESSAALLTHAAHMAARLGLSRVRAFETPGFDWEVAAPKTARIERDGCLPMLKPLRPGVRAEDWTFVPRALWV